MFAAPTRVTAVGSPQSAHVDSRLRTRRSAVNAWIGMILLFSQVARSRCGHVHATPMWELQPHPMSKGDETSNIL
eukprot:4710085-Prymnesium_polylepis.1